MTATVHVYDPLTRELVAVGLDTEMHTRNAAELTGPEVVCMALEHPCDLIAEVELYWELERHDGQMRYPHPRMN